MKIPTIFLICLLLPNISFSTLLKNFLSFSNVCPESEESPEVTHILNKCFRLNENKIKNISNKLELLHEIFHLHYENLILIIAYNTNDAIALGEFLTQNEKIQPQKLRNEFSNDDKLIYDLILDNVHLYRNPNESTIYFAYPRETLHDESYTSQLLLVLMKNIFKVKLILTVTEPILNSDLLNLEERRELEVFRIFEVVARILRNVENYSLSSTLIVTGGHFGSSSTDDGIIKRRNNYLKIVERYTTMLNASNNGKLLAEYITNSRNLLLLGDFPLVRNKSTIDHINNLNYTRLDVHDYQTDYQIAMDCWYNLVNVELIHSVNSLTTALDSTFSRLNTSIGSLSGVFRLQKMVKSVHDVVSLFLDCMRTSDKIAISSCFQEMKKDLLFLDDQNVTNYMTRASNYSAMMCLIHSWFAVFSTVEYINESERWTHELKNYQKMLNVMNDWYLAGRITYEEIETLSKENITQRLDNLQEELKHWERFWNPGNLAMMKGVYDTISSNAIKTHVKIHCTTFQNFGKLQVTGRFIKLSLILNQTCPNGFRFLEIFALKKVIIDADINALGRELIVAIFSPTWEIVNPRIINLDGSSRNLTIDGSLEPKARNGDSINGNGDNGLAGLPGGPAGRFFGLAEKIINARDLKISLNGGNGTNGQCGGDGANGADGMIPSEDYIRSNLRKHSCHWYSYSPLLLRTNASETIVRYESLIGDPLGWSYRTECYIYGVDGLPGGNGGNGGVSGRGGNAGEFHLYSLGSDIQFPIFVSTLNGTDGLPGLGGKAGRGGTKMKVTLKNLDENTFRIIRNETIAKAPNGKPGLADFSTLGAEITNREPMQFFSDTARLYKLFVFSQIKNHQSKYINLYKEMMTNKQILKTYDTLALVKELGDLEREYHLLSNKTHGLFFFQFWKKGILDHFLHRQEYQTVLRFLDHMVSQKIKRIKNIDNREVFALFDYLPEFRKLLKNLKNVRKLVQTKSTNTDIDYSVRTQRLIQEEIQTNIDKNEQKFPGEIETILLQMSSTVKETKNYAMSLKPLIGNLTVKYSAKVINDIFGIVNTCLGMMNPWLVVINLKFSETSSQIRNLIDDSADRNIVDVKIPKVLEEYGKYFEERIVLRKRRQTSIVEESLDQVQRMLSKLPDKITAKEAKLDNLELFVTQLRNLTSFASLPHSDLVKTLNDQLDMTKNTSRLKTHIWVKQMVEDLFPLLELNQKAFPDPVELEIRKVFQNTLKIRNFHEEVYLKIVPLIQKMRESTESFTAVTYLDFKNFDLKSLWEIFTKLEILILEFKVAPLFVKIVQNLREAIEKLLEKFDKLQHQVEELKKIPYLPDLHLPPFDVTYVKDAKLALALAKVLQLSYSNNILDDYQKWMINFKQHIFPFAKEFSHIFRNGEWNEPLDLPSLAEFAGESLETYGLQLKKNRMKLAESGKITFAKFGYNVEPFHIWEGGEINRILSGERVTLFANVSDHRDWSAVRFSDLWLRITPRDPGLQVEEITRDLQSFSVKLLHDGDSYYRCGPRVFRIRSKGYNFEKMYNDGLRKITPWDDDDAPLGKFILSPYATWSIELVSRDVRKSHDALKKYESRVNIELVGLGEFSPGDMEECGDLSEYRDFEI